MASILKSWHSKTINCFNEINSSHFNLYLKKDVLFEEEAIAIFYNVVNAITKHVVTEVMEAFAMIVIKE